MEEEVLDHRRTTVYKLFIYLLIGLMVYFSSCCRQQRREQSNGNGSFEQRQKAISWKSGRRGKGEENIWEIKYLRQHFLPVS
jgi:hypothetical protein